MILIILIFLLRPSYSNLVHVDEGIKCPKKEYFKAARNLDCETLRSYLSLYPTCKRTKDLSERTAAMWLAGNNRHRSDTNTKERTYLDGKASFCAQILDSFGALMINVQDNGGNTAISWASANGMTTLLQTLLTSSEFNENELGKKKKKKALEALENLRKSTPLHSATAHNHFETVKLLLQHGANVRHADIDGITPLMKASINQRNDLVQLFLEHDHDTFKDVSRTKWTACHYAVFSKNAEMVQLLLLGKKIVHLILWRRHIFLLI
jgi:ankyrin repeat protein